MMYPVIQGSVAVMISYLENILRRGDLHPEIAERYHKILTLYKQIFDLENGLVILRALHDEHPQNFL